LALLKNALFDQVTSMFKNLGEKVVDVGPGEVSMFSSSKSMGFGGIVAMDQIAVFGVQRWQFRFLLVRGRSARHQSDAGTDGI
jgi:hypothetical protein